MALLYESSGRDGDVSVRLLKHYGVDVTIIANHGEKEGLSILRVDGQTLVGAAEIFAHYRRLFPQKELPPRLGI